MLKLRQISMIFLILSVATFCPAEVIVVDSEASGWYDQRGYSLGSSGSNAVGQNDMGTTRYLYNTYFVFSIPELPQEIADIQLVLELTSYFSEDFSEDVRISGVSTPADQLTAKHTLPDPSLAPWIYNDLMDGPELGVLTVEKEALEPFFSCSLNEMGLQMINDAAGGTFAIGLSLMNIDSADDENIAFNESLGGFNVLQITMIPEPGTILLLMAGTIFLRRNKK